MSGPGDINGQDPELPDPGGPEVTGDEALAAEYVLGVLPHADRLAAARRIRDDEDFAALVEVWESRLAHLADEVVPEPAPELLNRLESRLFGNAPAPQVQNRGWLKSWLTGGLLAALLLVVGLTFLAPPQRPALAARLTAEGQDLVIAANWDGKTMTFVHEAGPPSGDNQSYELWLIGPSGVPESLGIINVVPHSTPLTELAEGVTLAVSLEPAGGSTTGQPTGPVLVSGVVTRL